MGRLAKPEPGVGERLSDRRLFTGATALGIVVVLAVATTKVVTDRTPRAVGKPRSVAPIESPDEAATSEPSAAASPAAGPAAPGRSQRAGLRRAPGALRLLSPIRADAMLAAHGFNWVQVNRIPEDTCGSCLPVPPDRAEYMVKMSSGGAIRGRINPWEWLPGFRLYRWMAADESGVWITGERYNGNEPVPLEATNATRSCRSIARTGQDGEGSGILLHIDARTLCPTRLLDFTHPTDGATYGENPYEPGYLIVPTGLAFMHDWVWLEAAGGIFGVDPQTGAIDRLEGATEDGGVWFERARLLGAGFGSLWVSRPHYSNDRRTHTDVARVDPRAGQVTATFNSRPRSDAAFARDAIWWVADEGEDDLIVRVDPGTDTLSVVARNDRDPHGWPARTLALWNGKLYVGKEYWHTYWGRNATAIVVVDATTGEVVRRYPPVPDVGAIEIAILDGVLFTAARSSNPPGGLYWTDLSR